MLATGALAEGKKVTITGEVLDSACYFTKGLTKSISSTCAMHCAGAGSPLVILGTDGNVYWPIDNETPARSQNYRLIKVAGKQVKITGELYERGSSKAIVIDSVQEVASK
jgi:hypothetical protein